MRKLFSRFLSRRRKSTPQQRKVFRPILETLEDRFAPAVVTDDGTTLKLALETNEQLSIISNDTTYMFSVNGGNTFSDGGITDTSDFSAFGGGSLTLQASGLTRYDDIEITDTGTGNSVRFNNSGANTYSDSFSITLDNAPAVGALTFVGATEFSGSNTLSADVANRIWLFTNSQVTMDTGAITLSANSAGTGVGNYQGILLSSSTLRSNSGPITLNGRGGNTGNSNHGVFLNNGRVESLVDAPISITGTSGNGSSLGVFQSGANALVTTVAGNIQITGTSNTGVAVQISGSAQVNSTGTGTDAGTITVNGNHTGNSIGLNLASGQIAAVDGNIQITGETQGNAAGVQMSGTAAVSSTGTGAEAATISITGTNTASGGTNARGIYVLGGTMTSVDGDLLLTGTTSGVAAIDVRSVGQLVSTGTTTDAATITITGTNAGTGVGVWIQHTGTQVTSVVGDILITGETPGNAAGVQVSGAAVVS